eukprot:XP_008760971.1 PREDICTED: disks large homolog 5-like [Rattus norvegicus]
MTTRMGVPPNKLRVKTQAGTSTAQDAGACRTSEEMGQVYDQQLCGKKPLFIEIYLPVSRPHFRPNPFYENLKIKEKEVMSLLHNLQLENTEIPPSFQELKKEINFYCNLHSRIQMEKSLLKKKLVTLKQESNVIQLDCAVLQKYLLDLNLENNDKQEKTSNLQTQQIPEGQAVESY